MKREIVLLDGAVGTSLWEKAEKKGYAKDPVWRYNIEHPEIVKELCLDFLDAGAEVILTNTFGANRQNVSRTSYTVREIVRAGMEIIHDALKGRAKIALSAGPLSTLLEPYGDLTEEECRELYEEQLGAGMEAGADMIMLQTFMDVEMMKIAAVTAKQYGVPVFCTMTFGKKGRTMMGNSVEDIVRALEPVGIDGIGMNCSLGPDLALPIISEFREYTDLPLVFKPNAGMPILAKGGEMITDYDPDTFVKDVAPALDFVSYIGGCCGCNAEYIRKLKAVIDAGN